MDSIRERFANKFTGNRSESDLDKFQVEEALSFFRQELLALAEQATKYHPPHLGEAGGSCEACAIVDLIRTQANLI